MQAFQRGGRWIRPEHLLLALLEDEKTAAVQLLQRSAFDIEAVRADLLATLSPSRQPRSSVQPMLSAEAKEALDSSVKEARAMECPFVDSIHLLLGLLANLHLQTVRIDIDGMRKEGRRFLLG